MARKKSVAIKLRTFSDLTQKEKFLLDYLSEQKGEFLNVKRISDDTKLSRQYVQKKIDELRESKILTSLYHINPYALGDVGFLVTIEVPPNNQKKVFAYLLSHEAVPYIRKSSKNVFIIEVICQNLEHYLSIEKTFQSYGIKVTNRQSLIDEIKTD